MKLASTVSSLLHVALFAAIALLSAPRANAEFKVPALTGRVVDAGKVFTEEESAQIEAAILRLESATGGQMVVTTLPSLEGLSIEEVGIKLGDAWKIGSKEKDDGAILIIVVPERKMRLEVGIGWEGPINDARAGDVIRGLAPFFRANKYADGAVWAVESVQQYVTGKEVERSVAVPATGDNTDQTESKTPGLLDTILGIFCSIPLFALLFWCLWAIFVYAVIMPIWLLLYLIFALCGKELPTFDPASLLGLGFLADWADSSGSSGGSGSSSSSSYSSSSHSSSSSSSHYSGGGGRFGGGGASGGW